nr:hypothetical protein [uncultured Acetatifactor sp.]
MFSIAEFCGVLQRIAKTMLFQLRRKCATIGKGILESQGWSVDTAPEMGSVTS